MKMKKILFTIFALFVITTAAQAQTVAPVLAPIGAQGTTENVLLTFGVSATDGDAVIPTLTSLGLPTGASYIDNGDGTATFSWTPTFTDAGVYNMTFYANDIVTADIDSEQVVITITEAGNQNPVVSDIPAQTILEGATFTTVDLNTFVTDADNLDNEITWTFGGNTELTVAIDGSNIATITIPDINWNGAENITFPATDPGLLFASDAALFTVTAENDAPVLAAIGPQAQTENVQLLFNISATDVDGTTPNFSVTGLPTGASFTDNLDGTATFDWTPSFVDAGVYNVTFTTTDGVLTDNEIVVVTINEAGNQALVLAVIGAQAQTENVQLLFNISATDVDGTTPNFSATGLPTGASFTDNLDGTATFDWTPSFVDAGVYNVTFTTTDGALTDNEIVVVTINEAGNQAPVLAVIGAQAQTENVQLLFNISATDVDGTTPNFSVTGLPSGASFTDNLDGTATFDWTPSFVDAGVYNVTFTTTDGALTDDEIVTVTINDAGNQAPVLAVIGAQAQTENVQLLFNISATDVDGTTPNFSVTGLPTGASFTDNLDGTATFDWTPSFVDAGVYNVTFTTTDGALTDDEIVVVTINDAGNQAPVLAVIGAQAQTENVQLLFNISATDVDGTTPNFSVTGLPTGAVFTDNLDGTATFDWTPSFVDAGVYNVTFTTTDGALTDNEIVVVTINEAGNQAPVLAVIGAQAQTENVQLLFNISATDVDGTTPNFSVTGLPTGAVFTDNLDGTATFDWTPSFVDAGVYNVTFTTTDGALTDDEIVTVTINDAGNQAPVLAVIGAQAQTENLQLLFNISATDVDGTTPNFSVTGLPTGASFTDNLDGTATFDWTPSFVDAGVYNVTFTTTDGALTDNEIVVVTINEAGNQAPVLAVIGAQAQTENVQLLFIISATDVDGTTPNFSVTGLPTGAVFTDNLDGTATFDWTPSFVDAGVYNVTFTTTDGVLTDDEIVTVTINDAGNQAPVLAVIGAQAQTENVQLLFNISATDVDGTTPNFSVTGLPSGASFTDNLDGTATFDWTPSFVDAGVYNVTFTTTDGVLTDNEIVVVTINDAGNQNPIVSDIPAQTVLEGATFTTVDLNTFVSDVDNLDNEITWTFTGNTELSVAIDGGNIATITIPNIDWNGAENITFTATDPGLLFASDAALFTVTGVNDDPVLAAIGNQFSTENTQLLFNLSATDIDGTIPSFTTSTLPSGVVFTDNGDGTATFDWTPNFTQAGIYNITFRAEDGVAVDSEIVAIQVFESGNQAPVLAAMGAQATTEGIALNFGVSATDPDLTTPTLSTSALPSGASFIDNGDGTGSFSWTPSFVQNGSYDITFITSDGALNDVEIVTITVNEAGNQAPVLAVIGSQAQTENVQLLFNISASDVDGTTPTFSTTGLPSGASFTDNGDGTATFDWTPSFVDAGVYNVTFTTTDGALTDNEIVAITINEAGNQAPVLAVIGAQAQTENVQLLFNISATDVDGTTPNFSVTGLPVGAVFTDNLDGTATFDWTPSFVDAGVYNVTFTTTDGALTDNEIVVVTINEAGNQAPVLAAIGVQAVTENSQLLFNISATDVDGTTPNFSATGLPTGAVFIDNLDGTATFDWTPSFVDAGVYNVTFTTTDGALTDDEIVVITVNEIGNQAPVLAVIGAQAQTENVQLLFNISATDVDGTTPNFSVTGLPSGASFIDNLDGTATFDWTPSFIDAGVYNVTFTTTDGALTDDEIVTVTINEAGNQAPVLAVIGAQGAVEGTQLLFNMSATDPDATTPTFSVTGLPTGASFVDNADGTATFDWTPTFTDVGVYNVTFTTTDGLLTDNEIVVVTITDAGNQAPVLAVIGAQAITENSQLLFNISATDADGTTPNFSATGLPVGATLTDNLDGTATFDWTPGFVDAGIYNVTFTTTDGVLTDDEIVVVTVNEIGNQAPVLAAIGAQAQTENVQLLFNISATDLDGTTPTFSTTGLPSGASFTDNGDGTATFDWTPSFVDAGVYNVTFTTTDGAVTDEEIVTITINEAGNQAPVLAVIGPQGIIEGTQLLFNMSATDVDGTTPTFSTTGLPVGASFTDNGDGTATFDWTPSFTDVGLYNVTFTTTDGLLTDDEIVVVTVTDAGNQTPVLATIGVQGTTENVQLLFNISASDADGTTPTFTTLGLPAGASFTDNANGTATFDWTPSFTDAGVYNVTFFANDGVASDSEIVVLTVTEAGNQDPVLAVIGAQVGSETVQLLFNMSATDPDATIPSFTVNGLPVGASFIDNTDGTATFDWTPSFTDAGAYNVTFLTTDGVASDSEIVTITINEIGNQIPVLAAIGPRAITEGNLLTFALSASDADATIPSFTTSALPVGAVLTDNGDGTASFDWNPAFNQAGIYNITFRAEDGLAVDSEIVSITVNEAGNQLPVLNPIGPQAVAEGVQLLFTVTATDPDGTTPVFSATPLPTGAVFTDNGDGTGSFDWTPTFTDAGVYNVTFSINDGSGPISEIVTITVNDAGNQLPVLAAIGVQAIDENVQLLFNLSATDNDGTTPSFTATGLPVGVSFIDNADGTATFDWTPTFTDAGIYNVTFFANDGVGSDSELVVITVNEVGNQLPVLTLIGDQAVAEGSQLLLNISATDLDNIPVLTTSLPLPVGALFTDNGDGTATLDWTPTFTDVGAYPITFYASDGIATDSELVTITVNEAGNQTPVLAAIGPQAATETVLFNLVVTATDADGTIPTLTTSTLPGGSAFVDNGDGTASFDWTPSFAQAGIHNIIFYASDGVASDSELVSITVGNVNQAPILDPIGARSVLETKLLTFLVTSSDADGTNSALTTTALPTGATYVDNADGTGTFSWVPTFGQAGLYDITFYATDAIDTVFEIVTITVVADNIPPVLNAIGPQTVVEGGTLVVAVSATDPDGLAPALRAEIMPENLSFVDNGDGTGSFTFSPNFIQSGLSQVTIVADDGFDIDKEVVIIQIYEAGEQAPQFDSIPAPLVLEGELIEGVITAFDPDTLPVVIFADTTTVPANFTLVDSGNGVASYSFAPDFTQSGLFDINIIVTDGILSDTIVVTFTVTDAGNQMPLLDFVADTFTTELVNVNFVVTSTDPDGDFPIISALLPVGANLTDNGDGTGIFSWTPDDLSDGVYDIMFYATDFVDPLMVDSQLMQLTVVDTNRVPFINVQYNGSTIDEGDLLEFLVEGFDLDGSIPTIRGYLDGDDTLATNMTFFDSGNGFGVFTFIPDYTQGATPIETFYNLRFEICDGVDPSLCVESQLRTVRVADKNFAPDIIFPDGAGPFTLNEGENLNISVATQDPETGLVADFRAENLPLNATFSGTISIQTLMFNPDFTQAGQYFVSIISVDNLGAADTAIVEINVLDAGNQAPLFTTVLVDTLDVFVGLSTNMLISAVEPDGEAVVITATPIMLNAFYVDSGNGQATYLITPDVSQLGTVTEVTFIVTDPNLAADTLVTNLRVSTFMRGDLDDDGKYTMNDIVRVVNYLFRSGTAPYPETAGDIDLSGSINVADIAYLVNYLYKAGPRPPQ